MSSQQKIWPRRSRAYQKALATAAAVAANPARLVRLANRALDKSQSAPSTLQDLSESIKRAIRLLKAYASGNYKGVSLTSIASIAAALTYFVMPVDALPDFIVGLGLIDDAALLAWTFSQVEKELHDFADWEALNKPTTENK